MKRVFLILVLVGVCFGQNLRSQELSSGIVGFWEIETPTGNFIARLDQITSVSMHEYFIAGSVKVFECSVDTTGGMVARFYYLDAAGGLANSAVASAVDRVKGVASEVSKVTGTGDPEHMVTKHYPTTTHAKTAEYRLKNKDNIQKIYSHARQVWARQRGQGRENKIVISE